MSNIDVTIKGATPSQLAALAGLPEVTSAPPSSTGGAGSTGGLDTTGGAGSTGTGATTPPAPSAILTMPANVAPDTDYSVGSGPDQLTFQIGLEPTSPSATFDVVIDGVGVAQGLVVTSKAESIGGQRITLKGDWGPSPHTIEQIYTDAAAGNGTFNNSVQYNLVPCYANGGYDSRGSMSVNATSVFLTKGHIINWTTLPVNATPATGGAASVGPTLSTIAATINGTPKTDTLANLLAAIPAGGALQLPAGKFVGTGAVSVACTISGAGQGKTVIDCTGITPDMSKGVFVPSVPGVVVQHMTIMGASVPDDNGAAIRDAADGVGFKAVDVEFTGNQDGILTFASDIDLETCYAHDNGAGDGFSHELYIGGSPTSKATLSSMTVSAGVKATHALKSRAGTTTVTGGVYTGSKDTTGDVAGSTIDVPDGGLVSISGAAIALSPGQGNRLFLGFAMESNKNAAAGKTVTLTNIVFDDGDGKGGIIQAGSFEPDAELVLSGCTYKGTIAPQLVGWGKVTGTIAQAA